MKNPKNANFVQKNHEEIIMQNVIIVKKWSPLMKFLRLYLQSFRQWHLDSLIPNLLLALTLGSIFVGGGVDYSLNFFDLVHHLFCDDKNSLLLE